MSNYLARPASTPRGGILVLHAWWGLNDFFKGLCDRLAMEGYLILAPDLYDGAIAKTIPEAEKLGTKIKHQAAAAHILKSLKELQAEIPAKATGLIGFSLGAYWALWLVDEKPKAMAATVIFYGTRGGKYVGAKSAFLGHFAEIDEYESESGMKKLEKTLKAADKETAFFTYPGTRHWFFENDRPEFDTQAAGLAWNRTVEFLNTHLK